MDTPTPPGRGGLLGFGGAVVAAVCVTVWWGVVGLATEDFGSDCLFYFGESGTRADHCHRVNDRAEAWLPWLTACAWAGAVLSVVLPRRLPPWRRAAAGAAVVALAVGVAVGTHAIAVSTP
ncbi:hypothetical protein AB0M39_04705 [Streptomyces sp. NPDC051907]|uniref:hypothetical protein n=1 Tax=Streptomyces sp. NPDC051907 TaxID=3155284 RepID=UPI003417C416